MTPRQTRTAGYLSVKQISDILVICERSVRRLIAAGTLPAHRFGKNVRVSERDLEAYIASCRRG